jgi:putative membrane protein
MDATLYSYSGKIMNPDNPYVRFVDSERILRDELAIDRTVLANERTLLAYSRMSLTLVIAGLTFWNFASPGFLGSIGIILIPIGIATGIYGFIRFRHMQRIIRRIRDNPTQGASK